MLIHILIPHFWIAVEEQRRPDLRDRPVIIGDGFLAKTGGHAKVVICNDSAEGFGVRAGISLAHARQLCPEAIILSPETSICVAAWAEIAALLLTYTPLVETLNPGHAVCDVSGCERLFGHPVSMAGEIVRSIEVALGLVAFAGVGANRLVAQLAAENLAETRNLPVNRNRPVNVELRLSGTELRTAIVEPGHEAAFLAPFPVTALPEIDPQTLLAFQVLGIKTVDHLAGIPARALAGRFGALGARLAAYARGHDDRPVRPAGREVAVTILRRLDDDLIEGLEPEEALPRLADLLAADLARSLRERRLAGRLLRLAVRVPRSATACGSGSSAAPGPLIRFPLPEAGRQEHLENPDQLFPNQDSRIHSMLPVPKQPGHTRYLDPSAGLTAAAHAQIEVSPSGLLLWNEEDPSTIRAAARLATSRPVDDPRTLSELSRQLLFRLLSSASPNNLAQRGAEMLLEMSQFAPPQQITLPGLDGRPVDARLDRLHRQERILASRFGGTPFRHLEALNLDSILSEKAFRWADGIS